MITTTSTDKLNIEDYYKHDGFVYKDKSCEVLVGYTTAYSFPKDIILPDTVKVINEEALHDFPAPLHTLTIPSTVEKIGDAAFKGAYFKSVIIKPGLKSIGLEAFADCVIKEDIVLPDTVKTLENKAFSRASIGHINLENIETFKTAVFRGTKITDGKVVIGENVKSFGTSLFINSNIKEMEYNSALSIPYSFCYNCRKLEKFKLKYPVERIGDYAFCHTTNLKKFDFSEGLKKIGKSSFADSGITEAILPQSLKEIGQNAFDCSELKNIYIHPKSEEGVFIGSDFLYQTPIEELVIPRSVTFMEPNACHHMRELKKIVIDANVDTIPESFLFGCPNLTDVEITSPTIKAVDEYAFFETGLTEVNENFKNIEHFGAQAFGCCTELKKAYIFNGIIDKLTFDRCDNLKFIALLHKQPNEKFFYDTNLKRQTNIYFLSGDGKILSITRDSSLRDAQLEEIKKYLLETASFGKISKAIEAMNKIEDTIL